MVDFGTSKGEDTVDEILEKAMANLQKFSAPILKAAQAHPSKTTTTQTHDPAKGLKLQAELMEDVPSFGEILLGGVTGAVSGYFSGGNFTTSAENPTGSDTGKALGAVVGGFLGGASYGGSRKAGATGQEALGALTGISMKYKETQQQKMASDAVGTATQQLGELNNPGNDPAIAAKNAAERERITMELATNLVGAGLAADKAILTAKSISAINAPNSEEAQDVGIRAQRAIAEYEASGKTKADKDKLNGKIKGLVMGQAIKTGKMPANASALLFGSMGSPSVAGNKLEIEEIDENGNVIGPAVETGQGPASDTGAASPSGGSGIAGQLPTGVGEKGVSEDVRKMSIAATQVELKGQQAIDMLENDAALQSALSKSKGPVGAVLGTSEAEVYANGLGLPIPGIGKVGELGKHSSGMSALTEEEQAAVLKFNQLITPLAQAAGKMRDPGVLQGNEFKNAKDVTAALTLNPEQNIMMLKALLAEAASNKGLASSALPKGGNITKKSQTPGLFFFK